MNYPAASSGVSIGIFIIAPRGGEFTLVRRRRIKIRKLNQTTGGIDDG
jgi:hypothetical protein